MSGSEDEEEDAEEEDDPAEDDKGLDVEETLDCP